MNGGLEIIGFAGLALASGYLSNKQKEAAYTKIENNPCLTPNDKNKLKRKFKNKSRLTQQITSAAVVTVPLVALQNKDASIESLFAKPYTIPQSFCTTFPAVLTGIAGWSWLTKYKTSKKPDQQQQVHHE